jgi:hypothetical protein
MNGRKVGTVGTGGEAEILDRGTSALTRMPAPATLGLATQTSTPPTAARDDDPDRIMSGAIPYAVGQAAVVRIPVPGTRGLAIEFKPRGWVPKKGSTSTLFFQDVTGKRHLRLDFDFNVKTKTIDYHWNQQGVKAIFNIENHTVASRSDAVAYRAAKFFRHGGRLLGVAGAVLDVVSVVQADKPLRRASEVVAGWAGAWAGCKVVGAGGALIGLGASPVGSAALGVGGCIIGGVGGYYGGSALAGVVYDWAEGTNFTPLPEVTDAQTLQP